MAQRIIMIHGRSTKPCKAQFAHLQKTALLQGLKRVSSSKSKKVADGRVPVDFVYYGDINNRILAEGDKAMEKKLKAKDPHSDNAPCLPATGYAAAIEAMEAFERFDKRLTDGWSQITRTFALSMMRRGRFQRLRRS